MKKINILLLAALFSTLLNAQVPGSVTTNSATSQTANFRTKLSDFKATQKGNTVELNWTAATELDMRFHEVQKSINGSAFTSVGTLNAQNNNSAYRYSFLDAVPVNGNNYYRVRSVSNSGDVAFSNILQVNLGSGNADMRIIGNPSRTGVIHLQLNNLDQGRYALRLVSSGGQQVINMSMNYAGGSSTEIINLPGAVVRGMYYLQLTDGHTRLNKLVAMQ